MTPEQERWAEALAFEKRYGATAAAVLADRIAELDAADDRRGVDRLEAVAWRHQRLVDGWCA